VAVARDAQVGLKMVRVSTALSEIASALVSKPAVVSRNTALGFCRDA
jgi:hypothetical protein